MYHNDVFLRGLCINLNVHYFLNKKYRSDIFLLYATGFDHHQSVGFICEVKLPHSTSDKCVLGH